VRYVGKTYDCRVRLTKDIDSRMGDLLKSLGVQDGGIGLLVGVIVFGLILLILYKGIRFIGRLLSGAEKMPNDPLYQMVRGADASGDERYYHLGKTAREKKGFWKWVAIIIISLVLFDVFIMHGEIFKNMMKTIGR